MDVTAGGQGCEAFLHCVVSVLPRRAQQYFPAALVVRFSETRPAGTNGAATPGGLRKLNCLLVSVAA